jgi:hypothetical protein
MDGLWFAHVIRHRWPPVRLLLISGAAILEESGLPRGANFFRKPYDIHSISNAIRTC